MKCILTFLAICLLVTPNNSYSQCGTTYYNKPTYINKEAYNEVAVIAIPTFQYAIFQYLPALLPPPVVQPPQQPQAQPQMTKEEIDRIVDQKIKERMQFQEVPTEGPPPINFGNNTAPDSTVNSNQSQEVLKHLSNYSISVLSSNCLSCHSSIKQSGKVQLFDSNNLYRPSVSKQAIIEAVTKGGMPKNKAKLTKDQISILNYLP